MQGFLPFLAIRTREELPLDCVIRLSLLSVRQVADLRAVALHKPPGGRTSTSASGRPPLPAERQAFRRQDDVGMALRSLVREEVVAGEEIERSSGRAVERSNDAASPADDDSMSVPNKSSTRTRPSSSASVIRDI